VPPLPGPPPQSGGQSARAIATTELAPGARSGAMVGRPTAATTIATIDAALEVRRNQRRVDTPIAMCVSSVIVFKVTPLVR